jgi:hypothetical protein
MAKWIKKQDPTICCLEEMHLTDKIKYQLNVKKRFLKQMNPQNRQE